MIPPFDHSDVADLPEYKAAASAIDELCHTGKVKPGMLDTIGLALCYSDCCTRCRNLTLPRSSEKAPNGPGSIAHYSCPRCGYLWTCYFGADWDTTRILP